MKHNYLGIFGLCISLLGSCTTDSLPKPYGNLRLEYPKPTYQTFENKDLPFTFEYSNQSVFQPKKKKTQFDLYYPRLKANIYLDYEKVQNNLPLLIKDAEKAVFEPHSSRADFIHPKIIVRPQSQVYGTLYKLTGDAALNLQFHLTDSTQHFIRGAVYFNSHPKPDSLAPAIDYLQDDLSHLMETLNWE